MTCLKHLELDSPKVLTYTQLIQMALELELEINRLNKQTQDPRVKADLENASEQVPHIIEWLTTAKKDNNNVEIKQNRKDSGS